MIIDLTGEQWLETYVAAHRDALQSERTDVIESRWQNILVAELARTEDPLDRARELLQQHIDQSEVQLKSEPWPRLRNMSEHDWRGFSLYALAKGLAYGPLSTKFRARTPVDVALGSLIDVVLKPLSDANFLSNWGSPMEIKDGSGSGSWTPVSKHTFDALMIAYSSSLIVALLIVDED